MAKKGLGKCRKDNGNDLWYRPVALADFRLIPMSVVQE